jgi:hypothetical protein
MEKSGFPPFKVARRRTGDGQRRRWPPRRTRRIEPLVRVGKSVRFFGSSCVDYSALLLEEERKIAQCAKELCGKNIALFYGLDDVCHGHVPLEIANPGGDAGMSIAATSKFIEIVKDLPPPAFDKDISITAVPPSRRNPGHVLTRRNFPPSRLPGIRISVPAVIAGDPNMPHAWSDGAVLMDANRGSKFDHYFRMSGYYPKGNSKQRSNYQFPHCRILLHPP